MQYSIVQYSEVFQHKDIRFDSEHYHPHHLLLLEKIKENHFNKISDFIVHMSGGATPLGANYPNHGIPFLRVQNIMPNHIVNTGIKYISDIQNREIARSQLKENDVLLTITGSYGKSAVVTQEFSGANINQHSVKITVKNIESYFLSTFLNSKYGYSQSTRNIVGITRPALDYSAIKNFLIPNVSVNFQKSITYICLNAEDLKKSGERMYQQAKNLILTELGLINWKPKHQLWFVKNYSDTKQAKRIDAEYYQPKYDEIINAIKNYSDGWDILGNLVTIKGQNFYPKNKKLYQYIELANIDGNGEIAGCMTEEGQDLPTRARREVTMGDVVVSSIEGSLSSIALIEKEYNHALCSTGFYVINSELFNAETLLVLLKSIVGQLQLKKGCNGTILTAINKDEFSKVVLPKVPKVKQTQIQQKVIESFNLRKQSKHLLECAKRAVEMAIEQDEQTAIRWLENET